MNKLIYVTLFTFLICAGCVTGPDAERKSPLNYLNGEHYSANSAAVHSGPAAIPVLKRKSKATTIKGMVHLLSDTIPQPIKGAKVSIIDSKGESLASTISRADGRFEIQETLDNGMYYIVASFKGIENKQQMSVSSYLIENIIIDLKN